jgi:hypothetical protein
MINAAIRGPIETYLDWAKYNPDPKAEDKTCLAIDIWRHCLYEVDNRNPPSDAILSNFKIGSSGSISSVEAVQSSASINVAYSGTVQGVREGGSTVGSHRVRIISAAVDESIAILNRDFAMMAIRHGLRAEQIGFPGYSWTGGLTQIGETSPSFDEKKNIYQCSGTLLISLQEVGDCEC